MIDYIRRHLGAKLLLSYLVVIAVGVGVLVLASQLVLPDSFNRHMANSFWSQSALSVPSAG